MFGVFNGRQTGVFPDWKTVHPLINKFPGARFKKFKTREEAQHFADTGDELGTVVEKEVLQNLEDLERELRSGYHIFTDGAFSSKTKHSGVGVAYSHPFRKLSVFKTLPDNTTNQAAELQGIVMALRELHTNKDLIETVKSNFGGLVVIWTDSDYSIKCITQYIRKWMKSGWTTASGQPVKNKEFIETAYKFYTQLNVDMLRVELHHILELGLKSHDSRPSDELPEIVHIVWEGNDAADTLATKARDF